MTCLTRANFKCFTRFYYSLRLSHFDIKVKWVFTEQRRYILFEALQHGTQAISASSFASHEQFQWRRYALEAYVHNVSKYVAIY